MSSQSDQVNWEVLKVFLGAPSKRFVEEVFVETFRYRHSAIVPETFKNKVVESLEGLDNDLVKADELFKSVRYLVHETVMHGYEPTEIVAMLPADFAQNLKELFAAIITAHLEDWQRQGYKCQSGFSSLVHINWRVDLKTSSSSSSRIAQPTVQVELKVQPPSVRSDEFPGQERVHFEIDKTTMQAMLEGLGKIRDQLSSIAQ